MTTSPSRLNGGAWGVRASDWATVQEPTMRPACQAVLDELSPWTGRSLLDVGCGAGAFTAMVTSAGATSNGLDACAPLIALARRRNPGGRYVVGDMQHLPFPDNAFDVVTAFNSLHFAGNPAAAIAETIRVTRPGGHIVLAAWGPPEECDAITYLLDLGALMPSDSSSTLDTTDPAALRSLLDRDGLTLSPWRTVPCPWHYADLHTALRGLLSTGPAAQAIDHSGMTQVTETIAQSIDPYRRPDGSYHLDNTCHYLIAGPVL